ncbi:Dimethylaniline monooxygenase [N-oxide-forming] 5 [Holothuria leucospilota]|uniref:Flavin-containing monooxygenase n=1 Tax=Holothuria leucospilota TaxID=206669 RepID=A0A9Q1C6V0_HOLLE|nr:Dimethylaniline monooxygenase [N-oxide-forming] 5 [Holothuria leucospilota]
MTKTVAIVGIGQSGLAAVKACLEEGLHPTAYDKRDNIGGMWNYSTDTSIKSSSRLYRSLVINSCTVMTCFSDFPYPAEAPPFVTHKMYHKYLLDYADHFKLRDYIQLQTEVVKVEQAEDYQQTGRWDVHVKREGEEVVKKTFDFVMICSGYVSEPNIPKYPGQEDFSGEIFHTCQYRTSDPFIDKSVLVIVDDFPFLFWWTFFFSLLLQVNLSVRNGFWVYPRRAMGGWPYDVLIDSRFTKLWLPGKIFKFLYQGFLERDADYDVTGLRPKRPLFDEYFTVSDNIFTAINCGKVKVKHGIKRFLPKGVEFTDGTRLEDIDVVIWGTGYNVKTPYIDDDFLADDVYKRDLYKYVFPARLPHATLACIGLIPPESGLIPVGEQMSRWSVRVFKGDITLPPLQKMLEDISKKDRELFERYGRRRFFVNGCPLTDELAEEIGCYPSLRKLFLTDPRLAISVLFGPITPFTYRIFGPHSWPGARDAVINCWEACKSGIEGRGGKQKLKSDSTWMFLCIFTVLLAVLYFVFLK